MAHDPQEEEAGAPSHIERDPSVQERELAVREEAQESSPTSYRSLSMYSPTSPQMKF